MDSKAPKPTRSLRETLAHYTHALRKDAAMFVLLLLVGIYGFIGWRIFSLLQVEPSNSQVTAQLRTVGVPKVDPSVVSKINQLEDNSVSVQTLFDQARQNPFNE